MVYGSVYESVESSTLDFVEAAEYDEDLSFMEMGALALEEATNDWNQLMRAIALTELSYVIESGGEEMIYEAVDVDTLKKQFAAWIHKLWAKLKGIADSAIAKFSSFAKDDAKFITKYEAKIKEGIKNIPDGFSFKGYAFTPLMENFGESLKTASATYVTWASEWAGTKGINPSSASVEERSKSGVDDKLSEYRGALVNGDKVSGGGDFTKALKNALYGSDSKVYINKSDISTANTIDIVKSAKLAINGAKSIKEEVKISLDQSIAEINKAGKDSKDRAKESDNENMSKVATAVTNMSKYLRQLQNINATAMSTYISALGAQNRQAKAVCVKMISYANKAAANSVGESYSYGEGGSILASRFADAII